MPDAVEYCCYCEIPLKPECPETFHISGTWEPLCEFCFQNFYTPPPLAHMALARWVALGLLVGVAVGLSLIAFIWETSR